MPYHLQTSRRLVWNRRRRYLHNGKKGGRVARAWPGKQALWRHTMALLAMYDRLDWTSAIKLHFRGIRASLTTSAHCSNCSVCLSPMGWDLVGT